MSEQKPERNPDGTIKKGSTLNRGGRPRSVVKNYRDAYELSNAILAIAEQTTIRNTKESLAGMSLFERAFLRIAYEAANGDVAAAKTFVENVKEAARTLAVDRYRRAAGELAALKAELAQVRELAAQEERTLIRETRVLRNELDANKKELREARRKISDLEATAALG